MLQFQGNAYFRTNLKWLAHKIWMLKSNFKLVVLLLREISGNLVEFKPFKTSCEFIFSQIRIDFLKKNSNLN